MLYKSFGWLLFKIYIYIIDNERSIIRKSKIRVNIGHSANESTNELWILMERKRGQSEELHYCVESRLLSLDTFEEGTYEGNTNRCRTNEDSH